jgi:predicted dienelactone hydrolase
VHLNPRSKHRFGGLIDTGEFMRATAYARRQRRTLLLLQLGLPVLSAMALLLTTVAVASATPLAVGRPSTAPTVSEIHCGFVDSSRSVPDYATQPPSIAAKVRSLPTTIWLPPSSVADQPRPLVLFAAGYDSYPGIYAPLLSAWAKAGFVVAAPTFPDENPAAVAAQRTNTEGDLANEPADLAFVGHALEQASAHRVESCRGVFGRIEPQVLVVAGHSDGAIAAALFAFGTGSDPQGVPESVLRASFSLRAALIFSGAEDGLGPYSAPDPHLPLLMIQSAGDHCNPERDAVVLYRAIDVDERFFLLLRTAQHRSPFDGTDEQAFTLVAATSIRFLRLSVRDARMAAGFVAYGDRDPGVGAVYITPPVTPTLPPNCGPS